ncbi:MAG: hypothetical protein ACRDM7_09270, partial [Thermoleophilaceae bacterium]
ARERVVSFLHAEVERVATRGDDYADEARPEREGRVAGVLGALRAVGLLLGAEEVAAWRLRLSRLGMERPTPSDRTRRAADELLQEAPDQAATFEIEQAGQRWTLPAAT